MPISLEAMKRLPVLGLVRGPGRHRPVRRTTSPTGVVAHGFRHCLTCTTETVAILHRKGGHTCGDCGRDHYTEDGAE